MTYGELVQKVLACRLADMEMGLARSREQKTFIEQVSRVLDKSAWAYTVRMARDFKVIFNLEFDEPFAQQVQTVEAMLRPYFDIQTAWYNGLPTIYVCSRREHEDGLACEIIFGDVP